MQANIRRYFTFWDNYPPYDENVNNYYNIPQSGLQKLLKKTYSRHVCFEFSHWIFFNTIFQFLWSYMSPGPVCRICFIQFMTVLSTYFVPFCEICRLVACCWYDDFSKRFILKKQMNPTRLPISYMESFMNRRIFWLCQSQEPVTQVLYFVAVCIIFGVFLYCFVYKSGC